MTPGSAPDDVDMAVGPTTSGSSRRDAVDPAARDDPDPTRRGGRGGLVVLAVVVVAVLGLAAWWWSRPAPDAAETVDRAPTREVATRWSLDLGGNTTPSVVVVPRDDGVDDVVVGSVGGEAALRRFDGRTGREAWGVSRPSDELVVGVLDGGLAGPVVEPDEPPTAIRGIDLRDGSMAWTRPADAFTEVVRLDDGAMVVVDGTRCSVVDAGSGRATVTRGEPSAPCEAVANGVRWRDGDQWLLADGSGRTVARVPELVGERDDVTRRPVRVGEVVVRLGVQGIGGDPDDARTVIASSTSGEERWEVVLDDGPWWRVVPLGTSHVQVLGASGTAVLDAGTGGEVVRLPSGSLPLPTPGGTTLFGPEDGPGVLEANGTWSRSPDATPLALWDLDGTRRGTRDLVLTSTPVATADGVLVGHGPDGDRQLSLLSAVDLAPTWSVSTPLRFAQVVASSEDVVVVVGDVDGGRRLDVLGP